MLSNYAETAEGKNNIRRRIMPYGNGMGPDGIGPGTGRRLGYCAGYDRPGCYNNAGFARGGRGGMGRGRGGAGFGRGYSFFPAAGRFGGFNPDYAARGSMNEMDFLKGQEESLESELAALKERIKIAEEKGKE